MGTRYNEVEKSWLVCQNEGSLYWGFFSIHLTVTGLNNDVRYPGFVFYVAHYVGVPVWFCGSQSLNRVSHLLLFGIVISV